MKIIKIRIIVFLLLVSVLSFAQDTTGNPPKDFGRILNLYNSEGLKEGWWLEDYMPGHVAYVSYHNGKRDGLSFAYMNSTKVPDWVAYSINGEPQAIIYFSEGRQGNSPGAIDMIFLCSRNNEFIVKKHDGTYFTPYYKAYFKGFYPTGQLESEGFLVWDKDEAPEIDGRECGIWKYYDTDGNVSVKEYPEGKP